jgi:hypothetical protein
MNCKQLQPDAAGAHDWGAHAGAHMPGGAHAAGAYGASPHVRPRHVHPRHMRPGYVRPNHVRPRHVCPWHVRPRLSATFHPPMLPGVNSFRQRGHGWIATASGFIAWELHAICSWASGAFLLSTDETPPHRSEGSCIDLDSLSERAGAHNCAFCHVRF